MNLSSERKIDNKADLDARYIIGPVEHTLPALNALCVAATGACNNLIPLSRLIYGTHIYSLIYLFVY